MSTSKHEARWQSIRERMFEPVDSSVLVLFRIAVAAAFYFWAGGYLEETSGYPKCFLIFQQPEFLFKYWGFEWVRLWPGDGIYYHFVVTKIAAVALALGFLTRLSAAALCLSIAYVLLVERTIYVNHYYLLSCAAAWLVFLPAGKRYALDAVFGIEKASPTFARWQLWAMRFQLGMPYVFGAIAKLNWDWMVGCQPAGILLGFQAEHPVIGAYVTMPGAKEMISYGGILYDALVVPMLLFGPTRLLAVAMSLGFHLTNATILSIGVFPWFMLATLLVFFPPEVTAGIFQRLGFARPVRLGSSADHRVRTRLGRFGMGVVFAYVVVQLILPWRPWVLPGNPSWNERGHRFAWRMMLRNKKFLTAFYIHHEESGEFLYAPASIVMSPNQIRKAGRDPELIRQAAVQLRKKVADLGLPNAKIHALHLVSLNGREPVPMIDPTIDLSLAKRGWFSDDWVLQDPGRFRKKPWAIEKEDWWRAITLPDPFAPLQKETPKSLDQYLKALNSQQASAP